MHVSDGSFSLTQLLDNVWLLKHIVSIKCTVETVNIKTAFTFPASILGVTGLKQNSNKQTDSIQ